MPADLHVHTTFSDGTFSPAEIVKFAKKAGLNSIAITDHDVIDGIEEAVAEGKKLGVEVIPGIEFTTEIPDAEIHILGYYIDYKLPKLAQTLEKIQKDRVARIYKIIDKLGKIGIKLDPDKVFEIAGHGSAGRPHIARALISEEHVRNIREAFSKYLSHGGPAYVKHFRLTPEEAIKLILEAKGVPVFAHPAVSNCDEIIPDLVAAGLKGIEVFYSGHSKEKEKHYLGLAEKYNLLATGGTDFHGLANGREIELGDVAVPDELVAKLKAAKESG